MENDVDIYIIQKQTALQRYAKKYTNIDFMEYLEKDGQSVTGLKSSHDAHMKSKEHVLTCLDELGLSYRIYNLDEIQETYATFYNDKQPNSGLKPKKKLIISLGGDGTLLHASHYVGGDVTLLGINSCPAHSVGHLCAITAEKTKDTVALFLQGSLAFAQVRRLKMLTSQNQYLPLTLNDILICNRHPAATSRYQIAVFDKETGVEILSEKQLSSGLWVSSAAGSSAAIASYQVPPTPLSSSKVFVVAREPYTQMGEVLKLKKFTFDGDKKELFIFSRMRQGLACVDGPDFCAELGFGETMHISMPPSCALRLVKKI